MTKFDDAERNRITKLAAQAVHDEKALEELTGDPAVVRRMAELLGEVTKERDTFHVRSIILRNNIMSRFRDNDPRAIFERAKRKFRAGYRIVGPRGEVVSEEGVIGRIVDHG